MIVSLFPSFWGVSSFPSVRQFRASDTTRLKRAEFLGQVGRFRRPVSDGSYNRGTLTRSTSTSITIVQPASHVKQSQQPNPNIDDLALSRLQKARLDQNEHQPAIKSTHPFRYQFHSIQSLAVLMPDLQLQQAFQDASPVTHPPHLPETKWYQPSSRPIRIHKPTDNPMQPPTAHAEQPPKLPPNLRSARNQPSIPSARST